MKAEPPDEADASENQVAAADATDDSPELKRTTEIVLAHQDLPDDPRPHFDRNPEQYFEEWLVAALVLVWRGGIVPPAALSHEPVTSVRNQSSRGASRL